MDIELYYIEVGEGFPLVLLHGNREDHAYFEHQIKPFSARNRVITPDTRGHGKSPRGEAPFTLEQFAEDLKAFLDGLGISKCHLLGFSDGGNIALMFALKYPQYIKKLIINGANLEPSGVKRSVQLPIELNWAALQGLRHIDSKAQAKFEMLDLMVTQPHIDALALRGLRMPTLVIAGDKDLILESHTRSIAAPIPGCRLAFLPGDHFLAKKNWEPFNQLVLEFLEENNKGM
ncbi:MAG: alpha/beta hydrolase [Lawsonibacter sp.]|nr:alpha/beta hydrolase [Lawsonibacter sp.]